MPLTIQRFTRSFCQGMTMGDSAGTNPAANAGAGIEHLVERFSRNIDAYRQGKYNETHVRRELVERMLGLHKALPLAKTDHDKTLLQRQITTTDHQIDQVVYELYGLTEDEIRIVEGGSRGDQEQ